MKEENILSVARYSEGDMELHEKLEFEAKLQNDVSLQRDLEEYQKIHQALQINIAPDNRDQQLAASLQLLNAQYFKEESKPLIDEGASVKKEAKVVSFKPFIKYFSIAAVLLIGVMVWAPWSGGLYEKYRISKEMSVAERSASQQNNIAAGAALYNKGDYEGARKILQSEYMLNPQNPLLSYYFSITLIETSQAMEARTVLVNLYNGDSVFKYDAAYFIGLSFVKEHNNAEAVKWFQRVPQGTANFNQAQELIGKLK
ncbi:tetratricopeptide repeat protein [Pedobacter sp. PWIIR3]